MGEKDKEDEKEEAEEEERGTSKRNEILDRRKSGTPVTQTSVKTGKGENHRLTDIMTRSTKMFQVRKWLQKHLRNGTPDIRI